MATAQLALGNGLQLERLTPPDEIDMESFQQVDVASGTPRRAAGGGSERMSRWSRLTELARAMRAMKAARERERWTGERMRAHQSQALDALVRDVAERSPFYRERYAGLIGRRRWRWRGCPCSTRRRS